MTSIFEIEYESILSEDWSETKADSWQTEWVTTQCIDCLWEAVMIDEHDEQVKRDVESWGWVLRLSADSHLIHHTREELCDSDDEHWRGKKYVVHVISMMQFQQG